MIGLILAAVAYVAVAGVVWFWCRSQPRESFMYVFAPGASFYWPFAIPLVLFPYVVWRLFVPLAERKS